jgi:hypothetical protein
MEEEVLSGKGLFLELKGIVAYFEDYEIRDKEL